jgi:kynureninase
MSPIENFADGAALARTLDEQDELKAYRDEFHLAKDEIYFAGNSLGLLSKRAEESLQNIVDAWRLLGVRGWTEGDLPWLGLARQIGAAMAPLIGVSPAEVVATNTTTINLHQLLATFYDPRSSRNVILADGLIFPSDRYALQSHLKSHGLEPRTHLRLVPSRDGYTLSEDDIIAAMTDDVQLALLPSVVHHSAQLLDIPRLAQEAQRRRVILGIDCSHSIGILPHRFADDGIDFAFWCTYKYLNGGPGSVAGLFLNEKHFGREAGMAGWFGGDEKNLFSGSPTLTPASDAGAMQISTPCLASMAPLIGSLEMIQTAGIERIREKSLKLTQFLMDLITCGLGEYGFEFANPLSEHRRGGHVALVHEAGAQISKAWRAASVVADFRAPDIIRLAPSPLYTSFHDCYEAVSRFQPIMQDRSFERFSDEPGVVP